MAERKCTYALDDFVDNIVTRDGFDDLETGTGYSQQRAYENAVASIEEHVEKYEEICSFTTKERVPDYSSEERMAHTDYFQTYVLYRKL